MTQTRWYKEAREATKFTSAATAKSMLANDAPGGDEALLKDGWTQDRPVGWVEPKLKQSESEILQEAFAEIEVLKKAGDILSAENEELKTKLAAALKKGIKKSR